jgi:hypothetical protein
MAFPARYKGTCSTCNKPINVGQQITWSRREKGKAYHADCAKPDAPAEVKPATTPDMATLLAMIAKLVPAAAPIVPAVSGDPDYIPTAEEERETFEDAIQLKLPVKLPALVRETRHKLNNDSHWYDVLEALCNALADGRLSKLRVLLVGPPGTGKSTTSEILSNAMFRIPMHQGQGAEELIGQYHLESGSTVWKDDAVTLAMRAGRCVVMDEIDRNSDEVKSILYGILDDRPYTKTGEGKIVKAEKGYGVIATMNPSVTALDEAILDRFDCVLRAIDPHPAANTYTGESAGAMQGAVCNYFRSVNRTTWAFSAKPTVRKMRAFNMLEPILGRHHALNAVFGEASMEIESALTTSGVQ